MKYYTRKKISFKKRSLTKKNSNKKNSNKKNLTNKNLNKKILKKRSLKKRNLKHKSKKIRGGDEDKNKCIESIIQYLVLINSKISKSKLVITPINNNIIECSKTIDRQTNPAIVNAAVEQTVNAAVKQTVNAAATQTVTAAATPTGNTIDTQTKNLSMQFEIEKLQKLIKEYNTSIKSNITNPPSNDNIIDNITATSIAVIPRSNDDTQNNKQSFFNKLNSTRKKIGNIIVDTKKNATGHINSMKTAIAAKSKSVASDFVQLSKNTGNAIASTSTSVASAARSGVGAVRNTIGNTASATMRGMRTLSSNIQKPFRKSKNDSVENLDNITHIVVGGNNTAAIKAQINVCFKKLFSLVPDDNTSAYQFLIEKILENNNIKIDQGYFNKLFGDIGQEFDKFGSKINYSDALNSLYANERPVKQSNINVIFEKSRTHPDQFNNFVLSTVLKFPHSTIDEIEEMLLKMKEKPTDYKPDDPNRLVYSLNIDQGNMTNNPTNNK